MHMWWQLMGISIYCTTWVGPFMWYKVFIYYALREVTVAVESRDDLLKSINSAKLMYSNTYYCPNKAEARVSWVEPSPPNPEVLIESCQVVRPQAFSKVWTTQEIDFRFSSCRGFFLEFSMVVNWLELLQPSIATLKYKISPPIMLRYFSRWA